MKYCSKFCFLGLSMIAAYSVVGCKSRAGADNESLHKMSHWAYSKMSHTVYSNREESGKKFDCNVKFSGDTTTVAFESSKDTKQKSVPDCLNPYKSMLQKLGGPYKVSLSCDQEGSKIKTKNQPSIGPNESDNPTRFHAVLHAMHEVMWVMPSGIDHKNGEWLRETDRLEGGATTVHSPVSCTLSIKPGY